MLNAMQSLVLPLQEAKICPYLSIGDPILKMLMNRLKGLGNKPMRTVRDMQKCLHTTVEVQLLFVYSTAKAP